jgi:hypothetical protein
MIPRSQYDSPTEWAPKLPSNWFATNGQPIFHRAHPSGRGPFDNGPYPDSGSSFLQLEAKIAAAQPRPRGKPSVEGGDIYNPYYGAPEGRPALVLPRTEIGWPLPQVLPTLEAKRYPFTPPLGVLYEENTPKGESLYYTPLFARPKKFGKDFRYGAFT